MCKEIVCIEEIIDLQDTYSILELKLSHLIYDIITTCKYENFNLIDLKVLFHSLRDVPFEDEGEALRLCNELMKCIKHRSFTQFLKKIRQLKKLIKGDYTINGSLILYYYNKKIRWDTTVSLIMNEALLNKYPEISFSH